MNEPKRHPGPRRDRMSKEVQPLLCPGCGEPPTSRKEGVWWEIICCCRDWLAEYGWRENVAINNWNKAVRRRQERAKDKL